MGIPWQSILAGLGQGAMGLGDDINRRRERDEMLRRDDEIRRVANERAQDQDALNLVRTLQPMGGQVLQEGADPIAELARRTEANRLASGGAIPNSAFGIPDESVPDAFGRPTVQKIGRANVLFDPSKSQDAMQERRGLMQQERIDRRARGAQEATAARDEATRTAGALQQTKTARGHYEALKKYKNPLSAQPFDPEIASSYKEALDHEQAKDLQASAYHAPPSEGDWAPSGAIDKATGEPILYNKKTGARMLMSGAMSKPTGGSGGGGAGGAGQNMQARLIGAVSEGRLADERMSKFEESHLKDGKLDVGSLQQIGGNLATNMAASHSPLNIAIQGMAEGQMNAHGQSEYMQYMRDARLTARAEQLMAARGGSEAMANDNAFLARGGANAPEATVRAAQKSRRALFGKAGAVMQTLTPEQQAKLAEGLAALERDDANYDYAKVGAEIFGGGPRTSLPAGSQSGNITLPGGNTSGVTPEERAKFKAKGWTDQQIDAFSRPKP